MNQETSQRLKYFLYARKSSENEDRQMASIESQINELTKLAKENNLEIVEIFSESKSAKAPGRAVFNEMLEKIHAGYADGLICWKLNRLARNPIDGGQINWMLQQGNLQHIYTYGRSYYPTDNVIVMAVELGMAAQFIKDLSVDTKRGLRAKCERGWYPTFTTLGYIHNPLKKKGEKEIIKDVERFDLVRRMFSLVLSGKHTVDETRRIATEEWGLRNKQGKKIARSTFYRILSDPFYFGQFEFPTGSGNWYIGKHEPMISKDEFDKIQYMLGRPSPRPKKHQFNYRGLLFCGQCNSMITAERKIKKQKNGNVHNYTFYHCTHRKDESCKQGSIQEQELERQVSEILQSIEIPYEFAEWVIKQLKADNEKESESRNQIISNLQREYNGTVQKIDSLIDMRASNEITEDEFRNKKDQLISEKERLNAFLKDKDNDVNSWIKKAEMLFNFAATAKKAFNNGSIEDKKNIFAALGSNLLLQDKKITVRLENPLELINEVQDEINYIHKKFEPVKVGSNRTNYGQLYSQSPVLLPRSDSNRQPID